MNKTGSGSKAEVEVYSSREALGNGGVRVAVVEDMENISTYRSLLLELSNSLTSSDLKQLKFLCRDVIPAGRAEKITRPFEFFAALEQLNMLSEENRDFLASKLIAVNRNDLRNKLLGIQGKNSNLLSLLSAIG